MRWVDTAWQLYELEESIAWATEPILDSLHFNTFIKDLDEGLENRIIAFADDTKTKITNILEDGSRLRKL